MVLPGVQELDLVLVKQRLDLRIKIADGVMELREGLGYLLGGVAGGGVVLGAGGEGLLQGERLALQDL